jgi:hypothetical protein
MSLNEILHADFPDLDDSTIEYFESIIGDVKNTSGSFSSMSFAMKESLSPFLESYGLASSLEIAEVSH